MSPTGTTAAASRLATYGSLAPGRANHHHLDGLEGRWFEGHVHGRLVDAGWGAALGFPALVPDPAGPAVPVHVFESVDLPAHWERLDEFEGPGYRRVPIIVRTATGGVEAWIYVLDGAHDGRQATVVGGGLVTEEVTGWGGRLWALADLVTPMSVRVAATLRLADHIAAGRRTAGALAAAVGADEDALGRLLGHLVTAGVLSRTGTDTYGLTGLGEQLRDDSPDGLRPWLDLEGAVGRADLSFVELLHTVRTGEPAFPRRFGRGFWEDLSADPARGASFDALMGGRLVADAPAVAGAYPWGALGSLVDVGGGSAGLLIAVLRAHRDLRGTVVDLAGPVDRAREAITAAELDDRAGAEVGSFFDPLPSGAGGYVLSGVLHDWDDEDALRILRRCAEAASDTGRVLVVDHVHDGGGGAPDTEGDLRMLCYCRGRERTLDQLGELAASAGLRLGPVVAAGSRSIVELRPATLNV